MTEENTIVATATKGSTTQHPEISKKEMLLQEKQNQLVELVTYNFLITEPSVFIEHLNFLQNFFQENYDHQSKSFDKDFLEDNLFFVNQIKTDLVKQYQLFRDIDFLKQHIEILTSTTN